MFARYFFILVGGLSLAWVVYVGMDIIDKSNDLSPQVVFGKEDGRLLVVNRKKEFSWQQVDFSTHQRVALNSILAHLTNEKSVIISEKRRHFLVESSYYWTQKAVEQLLIGSGWKIEATHLHSIETPLYTLDFHKTHLYFHPKNVDFTTTQIAEWTQFDQKASAVIVTFSGNSYALKECYLKGENQWMYSSQVNPHVRGMQVDDNTLFAGVLPQEIKAYHFMEATYLASTDSVFAQHAMATWVNHGIVEVEYKNKRVIITDFKLGQDPISVLKDDLKQDVTNESHAEFKGVQLMENFPRTKNSTFYLYALNDFVVMSEDKAVCEDIVAQQKLGNSLSINKERLAYFYAGLPKNVSERCITNKEAYSRSIYGDKVLETRFLHSEIAAIPEEMPQQKTTSLSMNVDEEIMDFTVKAGKGNVLALTANGTMVCFKNGILAWRKALVSKPVGTIQSLENNVSLITSEHSIQFITENGADQLPPVAVTGSSIAQNARLIQWKGTNVLVYLTENGVLHVLQNGKERFTYSTNLTQVTSPIDCWISQHKLLVGVRNATTFRIIDCVKKRELRSFPLPSVSVTALNGNELFNLVIEGGMLTSINQKGIKTPLVRANGRLALLRDTQNTPFLAAIGKQSVSLFSLTGTLLGTVPLNFTDIENVTVISSEGKTTLAIIDGLENNMYIYHLNGKKIPELSLEASEKVRESRFNQQLVLSTIVDHYIIQYILNE